MSAEPPAATPLSGPAEGSPMEMDIDQLMDALARDHDRVPRNVIEGCALHGEAMVGRLRAIVDDEQCWQEGVPEGDWWRLLHAAMILGLIPSESAGAALVRLIRRMAEAEDDNLQDWLAGHWPALFRNKPGSAIEAVREISGDRALHWYIRCQGCEVVVDAARRQGTAALEGALDWLAGLAGSETEDWDFRMMAASTLLDFPRDRHRPLLDALARREEQRAAENTWDIAQFVPDDVEAAYAGVGGGPNWLGRGEPWDFYDPGAIARRQARWAEEDARRSRGPVHPDDLDDLAGLEDLDDFPGEIVARPHVRAGAKVGRNDPCPCGSGKKYKKCCLGKDRD
ncbi:MAG: SEC-C metal-binding domain-containing protein [Pseudomonadota bacterium]